jgi:hypothetical protein
MSSNAGLIVLFCLLISFVLFLYFFIRHSLKNNNYISTPYKKDCKCEICETERNNGYEY